MTDLTKQLNLAISSAWYSAHEADNRSDWDFRWHSVMSEIDGIRNATIYFTDSYDDLAEDLRFLWDIALEHLASGYQPKTKTIWFDGFEVNADKYREMVASPGKFEGSEPWVPFFYEQTLNGDGESHTDENDSEFVLFEVNVEESDAFSDLGHGDWVVIAEDDNGFVYGHRFDDREAALRFAYS